MVWYTSSWHLPACPEERKPPRHDKKAGEDAPTCESFLDVPCTGAPGQVTQSLQYRPPGRVGQLAQGSTCASFRMYDGLPNILVFVHITLVVT